MGTVVLDRDDMRRTLVRIAHEIVEKNPDGAVALVGIHRRGAVLARRLQALTSELLEPAVPLGDVDISFYRDDYSLRPSAPVVHSTHLDFSIDERTIVIVDDVLYTGPHRPRGDRRDLRLRAAGAGPAGGAGRSRSP